MMLTSEVAADQLHATDCALHWCDMREWIALTTSQYSLALKCYYILFPQDLGGYVECMRVRNKARVY